MLDEIICELSGDAALALVQSLRREAIELRRDDERDDGDDGARDALAARLAALDGPTLEMVARTSTLWFHLVNAAEEQHRIRVLSRRERPGHPGGESVAAGFAELSRRGVSAREVQALLERMFVMPVLTAHPTEARRRTVLDHLSDIAVTLSALDRTDRGTSAAVGLRAALRATVLALYGTEESRVRAPTPKDEIRTGLDVFHRTLLDATPRLYRRVEDALAEAYPGEAIRVPSFLRWGTWIGGDRDGNPFITSSVTRTALERQRRLVIERYLEDVQHMLRSVSISSRRVAHAGALGELEESIARDRARMPDLAARAQRFTPGEPWREKLWYVRERLQATLGRGEDIYPSAAAYRDDLSLVERSLEDAGFGALARDHVRDHRRRAEVFGFHLASLDLRQHSAVHEAAVDELLAARQLPGYAAMSEEDKQGVLVDLLESADLGLSRTRSSLSAPTREVLATLEVIGRARRELGPRACERYVVSFTNQPSDLLEVLFLIRAARLSPGELRPVPLLEQLEDLARAREIAERMLSLAPIRAALRGELEIMIGYSDAGKQIGYLASQVALRRAQQALADVAEEHGVVLTIFHGRGGTIGRGGGPANRAIRSQPPRALNGRLRVTEQGETITARYGRADIACRDLEQMVHAVLVSPTDVAREPEQEERALRRGLLDAAGEGARAAYATLLADEDKLARYAIAATPIQQVSKLRIGSRPSSRKPGFAFDDLRAIPWVFSWNQSRHGLPGWFGLGSGLAVIVEREGLERARELYRDWPFFRALINNAQLALTRADIDVAAHYAELADDGPRDIFTLIRAEHERTVRHVLDVVDRQTLLGNRPHLVRSVVRRNPQIDVLSHTQIELMRRLASTDAVADADEHDAILSILFVTINGIAAGLQTAG